MARLSAAWFLLACACGGAPAPDGAAPPPEVAAPLPPAAPPSPAARVDIAAVSLPTTPAGRVYVGLEQLVPTPQPRLDASTFALDGADRVASPREARDGVRIVVTPFEARSGGGTLDGLVDGDRTLVPAALTAEDHAWFDGATAATSIRLFRVLRLATVTPTHVSAWLGESAYTTGAAHSNNTLSCGTWSRRTGKRLTLAQVLGAKPAAARLGVNADAVRRRDAGDDERWYQLELSEVEEARWPEGDTDAFLLDAAGVPFLCLPVEVGPGGGTWVWRLETPPELPPHPP